MEDLSDEIANDLLWIPHGSHSQNDSSTFERKQLFNTYYNDFMNNIDTSKCDSQPQNQFYGNDFFQFIQTDSKYTNNPSETSINFYNLLPMDNILNNSYYTTKAKHIGNNIQNSYHIPTLYTYVLSVNKDGYLPSLQLRFGEIVNKLQHDKMKHLMLNNNKRYILWAGEFWYIYDYKHAKYVLLVDNASGHWKPQANKIPEYIQQLLIRTLFPKYNISKLQDEKLLKYDYVNFYRPLIIIGYKDFPWKEIKEILFPVVTQIKHLYKVRNKQKKKELMTQLYNKMKQRYGKKIKIRRRKKVRNK